MLADVVAVVGHKNEQRAFRNTALVECVQHLAQLRVHVRNVRKVAAAHLRCLRRRRHSPGAHGTKHLGALVEGDLRGAFGPGGVEHWERFGPVEVPVFLGGVEGRVGFPKAHGQEERLVLHLVEHAHGLCCHTAVVVGFVRDVPAFGDGRVSVLPVALGREIWGRFTGNLRCVVAVVCKVQKLRRTPRARIPLCGRVPVVKDFSGAARFIAVLLEPLRQRAHPRVGRPKVRAVVPDAQRVGAQTGQQRTARGVAHRLLAVGPVKRDGAACEPVEVRRERGRAVKAGFRAVVVGHDEEHVHRRGEGERGEKEEQNEAQHAHSSNNGISVKPARSAVIAGTVGGMVTKGRTLHRAPQKISAPARAGRKTARNGPCFEASFPEIRSPVAPVGYPVPAAKKPSRSVSGDSAKEFC